MPDQFDIEAEARRAHADACRDYNPDVSPIQIDRYWEQIGEESRAAFRRGARLRLAEEASR